jgi:2-haloacid dehalogenase
MKNSNSNHIAIVFDFGGVLIDWDPRYLYQKLFKGDQEAMERFLSEVSFYEWNLGQDEGRLFSEAVAELSARYPMYGEMIRAYDEHYEESIAGPIQPTVEILASLKRRGYPLYALSNWSAEKFHVVQHKYEFFSWFETILLSGEVKLSKPDARIFQIFLQRIGRTANECLLIDDSAKNIATARQLGFKTIHFQSPELLSEALHQMGML